MYKYTPEKNSKADNIAIFLFAIAVIFFVLSALAGSYAGLIQAAGVIFLGGAIFILCRYTLSTYTYAVEDGNFVVFRSMGTRGKINTLCNIAMKAGTEIVKYPKTAEEKSEYRKNHPDVRTRFNYCRTMFPENAYAFILNFNGKKTELIFEANEEFLQSMKTVFEKVRAEYIAELYGDEK